MDLWADLRLVIDLPDLISFDFFLILFIDPLPVEVAFDAASGYSGGSQSNGKSMCALCLMCRRRRWQKHERLQCKSGSIHCCMHTRRNCRCRKTEEGGPHTAEVKTKHFMQVDNEFYFCSFFICFTQHTTLVCTKNSSSFRVLETIQ